MRVLLIEEFPDDVADAFEDFKLAILRHRGDGWRDIEKDDVTAALDVLKEMANAPHTDESPF